MASKYLRWRLFQWFMLCMIIFCIGGGVALLMEQQQLSTRATRALPQYGDIGVTGAPTLTAATMDAIFTRAGSPMAGTGKAIEQASRQAQIDDAFAMAVWWTESNDGAAGVGLSNRNPGGVRGSFGYPSDGDGYTIYPSYTAAVAYWFNMLRNNYVNRGLKTVSTIARPYVGTTSYPLWAGKVIALMWNYRGMAPPPPAVTPQPEPTISPAVLAIKKARYHKLIALLQSLSDGNARPVYTQGLTQEASPPQTQTTPTIPRENTPAMLPASIQFAVLLLGLLLAVVIAFFAHLKLPVTGRRQPVYAVEITLALDDDTPCTENLPLLPTSSSTPMLLPIPAVPISECQPGVTDALPRRIKLLPAYVDTDSRTPVTVGSSEHAGRSQGLLSSYGRK